MIDFSQAVKLIEDRQYQQAAALLIRQPVEELPEEAFAQLEGCLAGIPEEDARQSAGLCFLSLCAALRRGRARAARQWHAHLAALRDGCRSGQHERAQLACTVCCAGMLLPKTDNAQILLLLSILHNETARWKLPPIPLAITARRPSVLRGMKDLSEWGRNYRAVGDIVRPLLESVSGAQGAVAAATAELLYERGELNAASAEVAGALSAPSPQIAFAGYVQLIRITRLDGNGIPRAEELLAQLGGLIEERHAESLAPNYRAFGIRLDIHAGRLDGVRAWMEQSAGGGFDSCCMENAYELMTRAKALISLGRPREAVTLLESILLALREDFRPLDTAECLVDGAIACELLGSRDLALDRLEEALLTVAPYRYVRVVADAGQVALRLLGQLVKEPRRVQNLPARYLSAVMEAAKNYAMLYPQLYSQEAVQCGSAYRPDLTSMELQVLQLLGAGKSNNQIGERLGITLRTVKFHISNLFEKLDAKNRVEAVNAAKELKLL